MQLLLPWPGAVDWVITFHHHRFGWLHQNVLSWYHLWSPLYSETWLNYQNAMENHWQLLFPTVSPPMDFHLAEAELARALLQIIASKNLAKALRVLRKIIWYGPPKHWLCDPAMCFWCDKGMQKGRKNPGWSMVIHGDPWHRFTMVHIWCCLRLRLYDKWRKLCYNAIAIE